ncbi:MAG TPA: hypothetical protein VIQ30_00155 [Pseudonocardia sp.]
MTARRKSLLDPADSHWDREVTLSYGVPAEEHTHTHYNRDDLRRLRRGMRVLEQLLKRCETEDLPALTWTVTTSGSLVGELSTFTGPDPAGCRESFMAWVQALELDHVTGDKLPAAWWSEHREHDGRVELRGARKVPGVGGESHLEVSVQVRAFWWTHDETEPVTVPTDTAG